MPTTFNVQNIVKNGAAQFAEFLHAYHECSTEIQAVVQEMAAIVNDEESTDEDKDHAIDVIVEALFPGITADSLQASRSILGTDSMQEAKASLDAQEAEFAEKVKTLMDDKGMTQADLAAATGVSQPAISNMLNRQCRPQQRTVSRLAEAFGVPVEDLWK